jgi:hypothetical protein
VPGHNLMTKTAWDIYMGLPVSALGDDGVQDPQTGKPATDTTQKKWREGRIKRAKYQYSCALRNLKTLGREGMDANDLLPLDCLCFVKAKDEWEEATGIHDWKLHPEFMDFTVVEP